MGMGSEWGWEVNGRCQSSLKPPKDLVLKFQSKSERTISENHKLGNAAQLNGNRDHAKARANAETHTRKLPPLSHSFIKLTPFLCAEMFSFFLTRRWKATALVAFLGVFAYQAWAPFDASFDYVVIGGGTAGITVGARLARHGFRVAVVEAGGYYEVKRPLCRVPGAATLGAGASISVASAVDWKFVAQRVPGADYRDIHYPRGKCMGGSYVICSPVVNLGDNV